jgi:hypothetical protein
MKDGGKTLEQCPLKIGLDLSRTLPYHVHLLADAYTPIWRGSSLKGCRRWRRRRVGWTSQQLSIFSSDNQQASSHGNGWTERLTELAQ